MLIDFVTCLLILTDCKRNNYDSILVIIDWLIKIVHYKLVIVIINIMGLIKIIIDVVVRHYNLMDLIITNKRVLFTLKSWSLLYYFLGIKQKLLTIFYLQMDV